MSVNESDQPVEIVCQVRCEGLVGIGAHCKNL